jgi:hypothetical protein
LARERNRRSLGGWYQPQAIQPLKWESTTPARVTTQAANEDTHNQPVATQAAIFLVQVDYEQNATSPVSGTTGIPSVDVFVANDGKSAARRVSGKVKYVHPSESGRIIQSERQLFADDTVIAGTHVFRQFIVEPTRARPMDYASDVFTVTVTITYDDGFNNTRPQHFCREMAVTEKRGAVWVDCGEASAWKRSVK